MPDLRLNIDGTGDDACKSGWLSDRMGRRNPDELNLVMITERILFPGLDGLASWLKRYYLSRS